MVLDNNQAVHGSIVTVIPERAIFSRLASLHRFVEKRWTTCVPIPYLNDLLNVSSGCCVFSILHLPEDCLQMPLNLEVKVLLTIFMSCGLHALK